MIVSLVVGIFGFGMVTSSVQAAGGGAKHVGAKYGTGTGYWMGSYVLDDGSVVWCAAENGSVDPSGSLFYGNYKANYSGGIGYYDAWAGTQPNGSAGPTISGDALKQVAYAVATWGNTTSQSDAIALKRMILQNFGVTSTGQNTNSAPYEGTAAAMRQIAQNYGGPYSARITSTLNADLRGGTASAGVVSQAGHWVPGYSMNLKILGGGVWDATGTNNYAVSTQADWANATWRATGNGTLVFSATITGLPEHRLGIKFPDSPTYSGYAIQRVMIAGLTQSASASTMIESVQDSFQISVATQTSTAIGSVGSVISDRLNVSLVSGVWAPASHAVNVRSTLYGPLNSAPVNQASVPAGTPVTGAVNTTVNRGGAYDTPGVRLPAPGYYVWGEQIAGDTYQPGWTSRYGVASETTLVKWPVSISTSTSSAVVTPGSSVTDVVTLSGGQPGASITATARLYKAPGTARPTSQSGIPAGASLVGTVTAPVTLNAAGNASVQTPAVTIPTSATPGWYTWVVSTPETTTMTAYTSNFGIPAETSVSKWNPSISTRTSTAVVIAGTPVTDQVTISGGQPGTSVTATARLYKAPGFAKPTPSATVPDGATLVGTVTVPATLDATGTAVVNTPAVTVPAGGAPGWYTWVVSTPTTETMNAHTSNYGEPTETSVHRWTPKVVTATSDLIAEPGTVLTDHLTITGLWPGTSHDVVSTLYGPFLHRPAESSEPPTDAPVVGTVTTTVPGDGEFETEGLEITAEGYYVWHETIAESEAMIGWSAPFGVVEETTLIRWMQPEVITQASENVVTAGTEVTDTLHITGFWPGWADVEQPDPGAIPDVPEEDGEGSDPSPTVPLTPLVPSTPIATLGASEDGVVAEPSDDATEGTTDSEGEDGGEVDEAIPPTGARVVSTLYGPFLERPERAATPPAGAPVAGVVTTMVTGNGTVVTDPVTVHSDGYYVWHETMPESEQQAGWVAPFATVEETMLIVWEPFSATQVTRVKAAPGWSLEDQVWLSGLPDNAGELADEDDQVLVSLYYVPFGEQVSSLSCTADSLYATATVPLKNGKHVAGVNGEFTIPEDPWKAHGTWLFVHSWPGSERIAAFSGECADPTETTTVAHASSWGGNGKGATGRGKGMPRTGASGVLETALLAGGLVLAGSAFVLVRRRFMSN